MVALHNNFEMMGHGYFPFSEFVGDIFFMVFSFINLYESQAWRQLEFKLKIKYQHVPLLSGGLKVYFWYAR